MTKDKTSHPRPRPPFYFNFQSNRSFLLSSARQHRDINVKSNSCPNFMVSALRVDRLSARPELSEVCPCAAQSHERNRPWVEGKSKRHCVLRVRWTEVYFKEPIAVLWQVSLFIIRVFPLPDQLLSCWPVWFLLNIKVSPSNKTN